MEFERNKMFAMILSRTKEIYQAWSARQGSCQEVTSQGAAASDTSPMYLQFFDVSCYYIICFGYFICINMLFYIIFGTNILIQCLVRVPVCCMFFVSQKIHIKQSPNVIKTYGDFFGIYVNFGKWNQ